MKLTLRNNEYFEIYFKENLAYIVYGHLYYDVHFGFSQVYKDKLETESIKRLLKELDSNCLNHAEEFKEYMIKNQYYLAVYKLDSDYLTYSIKDENSNKIVATETSITSLIENNILKWNETKEL